MITRATLSSVVQGLPKYRSMLAGNTAYNPQSSGYQSIATVTLSSAANTITFSGIPNTFTDLEIRGIVKVDYTAGFRGINYKMNFNGETTGTNYTLHDMRSYGTGYDNANSSNGTSEVSLYSGALSNFSGYGAYYGALKAQIFSYAKTNKNKTGYYITSSEANIADTEMQLSMTGFGYKSLSAISTITFTASYNSGFVAGTTIALYGIGSGVA